MANFWTLKPSEAATKGCEGFSAFVLLKPSKPLPLYRGGFGGFNFGGEVVCGKKEQDICLLQSLRK